MAKTDNKPLPELSLSDAQRFLSKVYIRNIDQCWPWLGGYFNDDYGQFWYTGSGFRAPRVAYRFWRGTDPGELFVCHKCDYPPCCNWTHLFLAPPGENIADASRKGRMASGDRNGARLYPERLVRGDQHHFRRHPETKPCGDCHGSRTHPERLKRGAENHLTKIPYEVICEVRQLYATGNFTQVQLADRFKISQTHVSRIVRLENRASG